MTDPTRTIDPHRRIRAWVLAVGGPALLVGVLLPIEGSAPLAAALMVLLAVTLLVASLGGRVPAVTAAGLGLLLVGGFMVAPLGSGWGDRLWQLAAMAGFAVLAVWSIRLVDRSDTLTG
jgi:two-component system, OmpR family, sensor histidine kinase KdpD